MHVRSITQLDELAPLSAVWNALAGDVPFRRFEWLETWWRHYGAKVAGRACVAGGRKGAGAGELLVLVVHDESDAVMPIGIAPWHISANRTDGRVIRLLGSGEVYSDYLGVLCQPSRQADVAAAVAQWLLGAGRGTWDALELGAVAADDSVVPLLVENLRDAEHLVSQRRGDPCWRLALPATWDDYLALLSKSHRKQVRRAVRRTLDSGKATFEVVRTTDELPTAMRQFADLHQRRRASLGQRGCFGSPRFASFLPEVTEKLMPQGIVQFARLSIDGELVATDYLLSGERVVYAYQGGIDPRRLALGPGRLLAVAEIRHAIAEGREAFDLLRGNEPFKAHLRAEPRGTIDYRVAGDGLACRVRHAAWLARSEARYWVRQGLQLADDARRFVTTPTANHA